MFVNNDHNLLTWQIKTSKCLTIVIKSVKRVQTTVSVKWQTTLLFVLRIGLSPMLKTVDVWQKYTVGRLFECIHE